MNRLAVVAAFEDRGNPFSPMGMDLYAMDLMVTVNGNNANSPKNLAEIDYGQYNFFINDHLLNCSRPSGDPIPINHLTPFCQPSVHAKKDSRLSAVKNYCALFSRLYIGGQTRGGDPTEFFPHENQAFPSSIFDNRLLHFGKIEKADLLQCIDKN